MDARHATSVLCVHWPLHSPHLCNLGTLTAESYVCLTATRYPDLSNLNLSGTTDQLDVEARSGNMALHSLVTEST